MIDMRDHTDVSYATELKSEFLQCLIFFFFVKILKTQQKKKTFFKQQMI